MLRDPGLLETRWRRLGPNGGMVRCDIHLTEEGLETRLRDGEHLLASQLSPDLESARAAAEIFRHAAIGHASLQDSAAKHWIKTHANGWVGEVWRGPDAYYHYRAYHADVIPDDYRHAARSLHAARELADKGVPSHVCHCPDWQEWRLTLQAFPPPPRARDNLSE